jgi:methionine-rich copper-binding protein CopC
MIARRSIALAALLAAAATAAPALAHAHLESASIAEGAKIAMAPDKLTLKFEEPVSLAGAKLAKLHSGDVKLDFKPSKTPAATFAVPLPSLGAGSYTFTWRAMSDDGHVMSQTIHFTVTGMPGMDGSGHMTGHQS